MQLPVYENSSFRKNQFVDFVRFSYGMCVCMHAWVHMCACVGMGKWYLKQILCEARQTRTLCTYFWLSLVMYYMHTQSDIPKYTENR